MDRLQVLLSESINSLKTDFVGSSNTTELISCVKQMIPINEDNVKVIQINGSCKKFYAKLSCKLLTLNHVQTFINEYNIRNSETLRPSSTQKLSEKSPYTYIRYFRCQHNTRYQNTMSPAEVLTQKPSKRMKNTNCPFSMSVKLSKDLAIADSLITLEWNHNHPVKSLQSLSFKDVPADVKNKICELFESGSLPGAAHREYMRQTRTECSDDIEYHKRLSDRSIVPRRSDFNNFYSEFNKKHFGGSCIKDMFTKLQERVEELTKVDGYLFGYQEFSQERNQPFILIIITPLMKRVHGTVRYAYIYFST